VIPRTAQKDGVLAVAEVLFGLCGRLLHTVNACELFPVFPVEPVVGVDQGFLAARTLRFVRLGHLYPLDLVDR
jgi:hypothetical protein